MNDLALKLKAHLITMLTRNEQNLDIPYLTKKDRIWSRRELAAEIEAPLKIRIAELESVKSSISDEEIETLLNDYESYCRTFIASELIKKYIKHRHDG